MSTLPQCSCKIPRTTVTALIAFVLAFDLAFAAQRLSGAYRSEFGGQPQEARSLYGGPLLEGLYRVVCERLARKGNVNHSAPAKTEFASLWEAHYPRVQSGRKPPCFTALEAAWTLVFPATRGSLLILMAGLSATLATLLYLGLRKEFGAMLAGLASALLLLIPVMRDLTAAAMPDVSRQCFFSALRCWLGSFWITVGVGKDSWQDADSPGVGLRRARFSSLCLCEWYSRQVLTSRAIGYRLFRSRSCSRSQAHAGW